MQQAQELRNAFKGLGTDEKVVIRIAAGHNFIQRQEIAQAFEASFGKSLEAEIRKELAGQLENLMVGMFQPHYIFWAKEIREAIKGAGTDEKKLIPLIILQSDQDTQAINAAYQQLYGKSMTQAVASDIGSNADWCRLLKAWTAGNNTGVMDPMAGADQLHYAAKGSGTDEDVFIRIMCNTRPEVYRQIAQAYAQKYGKPLEKVIKAEFTGKSEFTFLIAHYYLMNPAQAVGFLLHEAFSGAGTNEELLQNVTVLFCDYFKGQIIKQGYAPFGDLAKSIKKDLAGKVENAYLSIWGL